MPDAPPRSLGLAVSAFGAVALLGGGALGGLVMELVGGPLAMGLAIWTGRTTEPVDPGSGFWWLPFVALCAASLAPLWMARRGHGGAARWAPLLSTGAAVVAGVLPVLWLWFASRAT
jgi:hypothetical protein